MFDHQRPGLCIPRINIVEGVVHSQTYSWRRFEEQTYIVSLAVLVVPTISFKPNGSLNPLRQSGVEKEPIGSCAVVRAFSTNASVAI